MDVKTVMDTWTLQMGFPVVSVRRNYEKNTATVSQKRFLIGDSKKSSKETKKYSWWIPLTFASVQEGFKDTYSRHWMKEGEDSKEIPDMPEENVAVVFNVQQTGYYRYL